MVEAPYLSVISSREPRRKAHETVADVKRAVAVRLRKDHYTKTRVLEEAVLVYQWREGWDLVWRIPAGTYEDELPWNSSINQDDGLTLN
ncbi:MAG: hypothetical protein ACTHJ9_00605 [Rhodanobacter sp.]